MGTLPSDYVIQNFYTLCKRPIYKKHQGVYNGECPVCKEGHSSGKKRRLFYFPDEHYFYCFNCSRSWSELNWLKEVTKKPYNEILKETSTYETPNLVTRVDSILKEEDDIDVKKPDLDTLPDESIDITNTTQVEYYKDRYGKLLDKAISYCNERRLFTAVNKCPKLFVSGKDFLHKNRLIIPFYSETQNIESYQTRSLFPDQTPKYLTKYGEKNLYGENNIDNTIPYIFIFEGPIDSMFVKNGVAMGGTSLTKRQQAFLNKCFGYEMVYVFDNDSNNKEVKKTMNKLARQNKRLFLWPDEFKKYKDINEICCKLNLDEFPYKYILQNSFKGIEAITKGYLHKN